jgi:hypothetical protein
MTMSASVPGEPTSLGGQVRGIEQAEEVDQKLFES